MIEGMVMELCNNHVIVMTKSGEFLKLKKRGIVNIGDIYKENIYRRIPKFTYVAAAALIFIFTSFAGYTAYANQIVGYVDIKGSKDVRLYVSRKGTVEKVDGLQNANQIKNLPVYQAIKELNIIAPVEGIYNDSSEVDVSTTKIKDSKLDLKKVNENVKEILSKGNNTHEKTQDKSQPDNSLKGKKPDDSKNNNNNNNNNNNDDGNKANDTNSTKQNNSDSNKNNGNRNNDNKKEKGNNKNVNFYELDKYKNTSGSKKAGANGCTTPYKRFR